MVGEDNDSESRSRGPETDPDAGNWTSLEAWEALPSDPNGELGYDLADWDVITPADNSDQLIFLPSEEEILKEDAFIIAEEGSVRDLDEQQ